MALTQQQRDERRREKAQRLQEEDLRLKVRPGTKQALLQLMEWGRDRGTGRGDDADDSPHRSTRASRLVQGRAPRN